MNIYSFFVASKCIKLNVGLVLLSFRGFPSPIPLFYKRYSKLHCTSLLREGQARSSFPKRSKRTSTFGLAKLIIDPYALTASKLPSCQWDWFPWWMSIHTVKYKLYFMCYSHSKYPIEKQTVNTIRKGNIMKYISIFNPYIENLLCIIKDWITKTYRTFYKTFYSQYRTSLKKFWMPFILEPFLKLSIFACQNELSLTVDRCDVNGISKHKHSFCA